jgi:hypothetical protein
MRVPFTTSSIVRPSCRPFLVQIQLRQYSSQLTITDPLIIYQNLVDSDLLKPDDSQFRAAVEYLLPQQLSSPLTVDFKNYLNVYAIMFHLIPFPDE